jgi:hypothetical protein
MHRHAMFVSWISWFICRVVLLGFGVVAIGPMQRKSKCRQFEEMHVYVDNRIFQIIDQNHCVFHMILRDHNVSVNEYQAVSSNDDNCSMLFFCLSVLNDRMLHYFVTPRFLIHFDLFLIIIVENKHHQHATRRLFSANFKLIAMMSTPHSISDGVANVNPDVRNHVSQGSYLQKSYK